MSFLLVLLLGRGAKKWNYFELSEKGGCQILTNRRVAVKDFSALHVCWCISNCSHLSNQLQMILLLTIPLSGGLVLRERERQDIVLMYPQTLQTNSNRNAWQSVGRSNVFWCWNWLKRASRKKLGPHGLD